MTRTTWRGVVVDARTAAMLNEVDRLTSPELVPTQGSYSTGVSASAGTHSGGGAVDLSVLGMGPTVRDNVIRAMRRVGFAAWYRDPSEGPWGAHIHAVAVGCKDLAPAAVAQVDALRDGRSGLASNGVDRHAGLGVAVTTWEQYQATKVTRTPYPLWPAFRFGDRKNTRGPWRLLTVQTDPAIRRINEFFGLHKVGRTPSSTFTDATARAVRAWQAKRGMPATGAVGAREWSRMGL